MKDHTPITYGGITLIYILYYLDGGTTILKTDMGDFYRPSKFKDIPHVWYYYDHQKTPVNPSLSSILDSLERLYQETRISTSSMAKISVEP